MNKFEVNQDAIHQAYQNWVRAQDFYIMLVFQRGTAVFLRDGNTYRYLPVQVGFKAWLDWSGAFGTHVSTLKQAHEHLKKDRDQ